MNMFSDASAKALEEGSLRAPGFVWMKITKKKILVSIDFYEVPGLGWRIPER